MTIQEIKENETATLKLAGRLDTTTSPELEQKINALGADVKHLVLDMEELSYVSSAGLRVILGAQKKMSRAGSLKLLKVCDAVMEVLEMTGFADILDIG
ncbi:MAG: STAS domain-containing protein [Clostridia bacterium]|nr:STAS domain-containing protein [Clostridia bacterium]